MNILLVEDDDGDALLIEEMMADVRAKRSGLSISITRVKRLFDAFALVAGQDFDACLIDLGLPDSKGIATIAAFSSYADRIPVIVLTGVDDEHSALTALQSGAQDYLVKGTITADSIIRALRYAIERKRSEEELRKRHFEISTLYYVSEACSRSIDIDELLAEVLEVITRSRIFNIERRAGVFLIDGEDLVLKAQTGCPDEFVAAHKGMKVGECLCGLAARSGEIITSGNGLEDNRHTVRYPNMTAHGHIIVPIRSKGRVLGVMVLYTTSDAATDKAQTSLLLTMGDQIGTAIENAVLYKQTQELSLRDPLTGLSNRRYMEIILEKAYAATKRGVPLSVIMFDIDHFKRYNDAYGHAAGDEKLRAVAHAVSKEVREMNVIARYGGEEFIVMLSETELQEAVVVAERIRMIVADETGLTVSLGVASYDETIMTKEDLIVKADKALYKAKQNGRDRVEIYL